MPNKKGHQQTEFSLTSNDAHGRILHGPAILVIDDDLGTRETFDSALTALGCAVRTARCGNDAIQIAQSAPFDLLLVDLELPDMRGTDVVRAVQARTPLVSFILVSAFLTTQFTVEAMRLGATDVLEKPVSVDELPSLVRSVFRRRSSATVPGASWSLDTAAHCITNAADPSCGTQPRSSAERWAMHALKGCYSSVDLKTLEQWAACAGVSYGALRESCRLVGMRPHDARDLVRVLRAVLFGTLRACPLPVLLDVGDSRTLHSLLQRAGIGFVDDTHVTSIADFFQHQQFVSSNNVALHLLKRLVERRTLHL